MRRKRTLVLAFALAVVAMGAVSAVSLVDDERYDRHGDLRWQTDADVARQSAADADVPVVVLFWQTECSACEAFDERVAEDGTLQDTLGQFERVSADVSTESGRSLMNRYDVSLTPTLVVVSPDGTAIETIHPASNDDVAGALDRAYDTWERGRTESSE